MLSVREIKIDDIPALCDYWLNADPEFLISMGVDLAKMPSREQLVAFLSEPIPLPYSEKNSYCIIWEENGIPVGHSNVNKIVFGVEAFMHLHLWNNSTRKKGLGMEFIKLTVPWFFRKLELKKLFCEPYALNPAPNKTLAKAGFKFIRSYTCVPGWINFEQEVNLWEMQCGNCNADLLRWTSKK